jgi:hypothetical protein
MNDLNPPVRTALISVAAACALTACGGAEELLPAIADAIAQNEAKRPLPSVAYRSAKLISLTPTTGVFENEMYFASSSGAFRQPATGDIQIGELTWTANGATAKQNFTVRSLACGSAPQLFAQGAFSAMMLFDRSGSMSGNDPLGLSVDAGKTFADAMGPTDEAAVSAFPLSAVNNRPFAFNTYGDFSSDKAIVKTAVNSVGAPAGGTPLYTSMVSALTQTASRATKPNKALLAFTDGDNNEGAATSGDVVAESLRRKIPIFPIGLIGGSNAALSSIATQTGGAFFFAGDARQLASVYKSLPKILAGTATSCTVTLGTSLVGSPSIVFSQSSGSVIITAGAKIDGDTVSATYTQPFGVN